jgi:hypothetical protein
MAAEWTRGTTWRQGSVIDEKASLSLGLVRPEEADSRVLMVISHDCDIAEDDLTSEPNIEVIVGRIIEQADPNLTHAKSPNRLHLEVLQETQSRFVELRATEKREVPKAGLAAFEPYPAINLTPKSRETLQAWLASRYRRAAFPDALNAHLVLLRDTLQKIGKKNPVAVIGFYIYYEPDRELTDANEPYEVWLAVVFDHLVAGAEEYAKAASERVITRIETKFRSGGVWRGVELRGCETFSDEEFSLYQAMTFKNYPLEYLSLRALETT